ncbi:MAG TPA: glycosyltransferase [Candidatus Cybelea sp.]|nr:glycosyltransferase [Candidatus Cybelea sp.]
MGTSTPRTFVVAVNNTKVVQDNFFSSACLRSNHPHQVILQEGWASASLAYNDAIERSQNDVIVFAHQDIILPEQWTSDLDRALHGLESSDPNWGVIGCYGETLADNGRGYIYSSGLGLLGQPFEQPAPVQTLDEIVLILRKGSGIRFDPGLPHFHLYGTDICMRAESMGKRNYVIPAFCIHNTRQPLVLPTEFYECHRRIRRIWWDRLPIRSTCLTITRSNVWLYRRRINELLLEYVKRKQVGGHRRDDVPGLIEEVNGLLERRRCDGSSAQEWKQTAAPLSKLTIE